MDGARPDAVTDEALDRELTRLLAVDHSPEFVARVRGRIASQAVPPVWSWRRSSLAIVAGAAAAAMVVMVMTASRMAPSPLTVASRFGDVSLAARPVKRAPTPETPPTVARHANVTSPLRGVAAGTAEKPRTSEGDRVHDVLVSPDERRAFAQLVAMLNDERVASAVVDSTRASEGREVAIAPIEITPLPDPVQQLGE